MFRAKCGKCYTKQVKGAQYCHVCGKRQPTMSCFGQPKIDQNPALGMTDEIWQTADGTRLHYAEMENRHLLNTVKLLARKAYRFWKQDAIPYLDIEEPTGNWSDLLPPIFWKMLTELEKRELNFDLPELHEYVESLADPQLQESARVITKHPPSSAYADYC